MPIDISKAKEENKRWKPKNGEEYYYIDLFYNNVCMTFWNEFFINPKYDENYYNVGNCFRTEKEAERALEKVKELLLSLGETNNG